MVSAQVSQYVSVESNEHCRPESQAGTPARVSVPVVKAFESSDPVSSGRILIAR
jgi:hypothetical protein